MTIVAWTLPRCVRTLAPKLRPSSSSITTEVVCSSTPVSEPGSAGSGIRLLRGRFLGIGPHTSNKTLHSHEALAKAVGSENSLNLPLALALFLPVIAPFGADPTECTTKRQEDDGEKTIKSGNSTKKERSSNLFGYGFAAAVAVQDAAANVVSQVQEALLEPDAAVNQESTEEPEASPARNEETSPLLPSTPSGRQSKRRSAVINKTPRKEEEKLTGSLVQNKEGVHADRVGTNRSGRRRRTAGKKSTTPVSSMDVPSAPFSTGTNIPSPPRIRTKSSRASARAPAGPVQVGTVGAKQVAEGKEREDRREFKFQPPNEPHGRGSVGRNSPDSLPAASAGVLKKDEELSKSAQDGSPKVEEEEAFRQQDKLTDNKEAKVHHPDGVPEVLKPGQTSDVSENEVKGGKKVGIRSWTKA